MACRVCDGTDLVPVVDLGEQPWANNFLRPEDAGKEPYYPLRVLLCQACRTAQLDYTVPKETMFGHHTYLSGTTRTLRQHFLDTARGIDERFFRHTPAKSVLDIGSNDGTQLQQYQSLGFEVLGVESCAEIAARAVDQGVPTTARFFNHETAKALGRQFHVVNASGVFFHLEELHSAADGVRQCLRPDGVFVVQFLYMKSIMENLAFDQIYHEHLLYYTVQSLGELLHRHGLAAFDAYWSPIHGGSMIVMAGHAGQRPATDRLQGYLAREASAGVNTLERYRRFAREVEGVREQNLAYLAGEVNQGSRIYGMGAPVKGNTLLNYFGVGPQTMPYLVEKNPLRRGLVAPGSHIPIILEDEVTEPPDVYYVLAWNFKKEILANNQRLLEQGVRFYFPVEPREVETP